MRLKEQLRYFLETRGMNASQLARKAQVPKQSLSDWLGGTSPRKLAHIKKVADFLGVTVDILCFGDGEFPPADIENRPSKTGRWIEGVFEVKLRRIRK